MCLINGTADFQSFTFTLVRRTDVDCMQARKVRGRQGALLLLWCCCTYVWQAVLQDALSCLKNELQYLASAGVGIE